MIPFDMRILKQFGIQASMSRKGNVTITLPWKVFGERLKPNLFITGASYSTRSDSGD
jgi:hypothetical protein